MRTPRLVRRPPRTVAELAKALRIPLDALARDGDHATGLFPGRVPEPGGWRPVSDSISGIHGQYRFDVHHERPLRTAAQIGARELTEYHVFFRRGRPAWEASLADQYGPAVEVAGRRRYGPFFLSGSDDDRFELRWFEREPDWAKPPVDEVERAAMLRRFAVALASAATEAERDAAFGELASLDALGLGMVVSGPSVAFDPPIPAQAIASALGHPGAIAVTVDVHMSLWRLMTVTSTGVDRLRIGGWEVDVHLSGSPSGPRAEEASVPGAAACQLVEGDIVRGMLARDR